jgi:hypothetical protein
MRHPHVGRSLALVALVVILGATLADAHQPILAALDQEIDDPGISHAIYGDFRDGSEVFTIRMRFDTGFALPFELLVPHKSGLRDHRPMYAVLAPGLPPAESAEEDLLPALPEGIEMPSGAGLYLDRNDDPEREVIFESFTRRVFWSSSPVALAVQPGELVVLIWSPHGSTGGFVFGFGVEEDFSEGFGDVFKNWGDFAY